MGILITILTIINSLVLGYLGYEKFKQKKNKIEVKEDKDGTYTIEVNKKEIYKAYPK